MDIGLSFFSSDCNRRLPFELFSRASVKADEMNLASVWIPERHYHSFGGAFPCPAVAAGALAALTRKINIRAGSVVSPLHDAIEVAEQWAMVHALSGGRAGLAFASGWKAEDFVTCPEKYARRKDLIWEQIEDIRTLWNGGTIERIGTDGAPAQISIYPRSDFPLPQLWVTTPGTLETAQRAGETGTGLFTHLVNQSISGLKTTIRMYREALPASAPGHVALMMHTYVAETDAIARVEAHGPLVTYLRQFLDLKANVPAATHDAVVLHNQLELGVLRYFNGHSLIGSPETCRTLLRSLASIGVDEVVCLIDFGLEDSKVMQSLERVAQLRYV